MSTIQDPRKTWLATGSRLTVWWRMGLRWMPSPSRSDCHLPASLPPAGDGPVRSQLTLLWCLFNSLFCEQVWLCLRLELCRESSLSLSFLSLSSHPTVWAAISGSSLRLSSGHSGPVLTLSMQPVPPCSALIRCWQTGASRLLLLWELWLGM